MIRRCAWCSVWLAVVGFALADPAPAQETLQGPLTVEDAVRIAIDNNYAFKQAEEGVNLASGRSLSALGGVLPKLNGAGTYSREKNTVTLKDADYIFLGEVAVAQRNFDLTTDFRRGTFDINVREDLSLPLWYQYRSARADLESARHGEHAAAQTLAFDVRSQFYLVLRAQDLLKVQEEDLRLARDEERRITSMFELGSVARVDVLKAKVRVSEAELALIRQQNAVEIEKARMATLLGFPPDAPIEVQGQLDDTAAPVDSAAAVEQSLGRPDLLQAQQDFRSATNQHKAAKWSWFPALFATFNWGIFEGSRRSDDLFSQIVPETPAPGDTARVLFEGPVDSDLDRDGWAVAVGLQVNLDLFLNQGDTKTARAAKLQSEYQLEGLGLAVKQELEEAILNYRASVKAIEAARRGVESADEDLRLSQERYQQGLGTILELLEAQVALTRARNNEVNALTGLKISEAALDKARGAPLPFPLPSER